MGYRRLQPEEIGNEMTDFYEDSLIEQPAVALFTELGWETANCYEETFGPGGMLGRETSRQLRSILAAVRR